jgi:hypothetical protein
MIFFLITQGIKNVPIFMLDGNLCLVALQPVCPCKHFGGINMFCGFEDAQGLSLHMIKGLAKVVNIEIRMKEINLM